jgi:hypothetical protein
LVEVANSTVSGGSTTLLQYRQQIFGRVQICRIQAFHNAFEYGLKNRLGASSFFSQNRSAYGAQQASARGGTRVSNAPNPAIRMRPEYKSERSVSATFEPRSARTQTGWESNTSFSGT